MNDDSKKELLKIARKSIENVINSKSLIDFNSDNSEIQGKQGVFVTLKNKGNLRGCLGNFQSNIPLYKLVAQMAVSSVTEDSRFKFDPITSEEINDIDIEISVLSELKKIDNPLDFILGVHGVYIKKGISTGCFLPQVAIETNWSKEEFLSKCCQGKAGIKPDAWKTKDVEIYIFSAEIFNEIDFGLK